MTVDVVLVDVVGVVFAFSFFRIDLIPVTGNMSGRVWLPGASFVGAATATGVANADMAEAVNVDVVRASTCAPLTDDGDDDAVARAV